jgi:hypothetical protein
VFDSDDDSTVHPQQSLRPVSSGSFYTVENSLHTKDSFCTVEE